MNKQIRTMLVVLSMLVALLMTAPAVSAVGGDEETKLCRRVIGINTCVAYNYGDCTLWVSAGFGGCFALGQASQ